MESRSLRRVSPRPEAFSGLHVAWRLADGPCCLGGLLAQMRQDPSTVFVAETLPTKRPVRPPAVGAQQLEAGGRSGEPGVAASCINTVAASPPPAAAPTSSAASTVSKTQQHEYLGGQHRRLGGASRSCRGEAFRSGASCSMLRAHGAGAVLASFDLRHVQGHRRALHVLRALRACPAPPQP